MLSCPEDQGIRGGAKDKRKNPNTGIIEKISKMQIVRKVW